jgi:1,4-dihydroxy-2-naphthoyl-CoA hydrolase
MPSSDSANDTGTPSIWQQPLTLDGLNAMAEGNMGAHLGIEFVEIGPDYLRARMPVDARTHQPFGYLHGGASVVLAETVGSTAANCCVDPEQQYCVGMAINANHVRSVRDGHVVGTARPLHRGRSSQVWQIRIRDDAERLVCASRLTMAIRDRPSRSNGGSTR